MMESLFVFKRVSYLYHNRFVALNEIDLTIHGGVCSVILGANGSGKSTLLKMMDALIVPSKGEFYAFGERIDASALRSTGFNAGFRKRVGFVFQDADSQLFLPTVRDEIAYAPLQKGVEVSRIDELVKSVASQMGLEGILDKFPFDLSEGEKKKVAIASVFALDPEVWLLDEPILALDPKTQWWVIELLRMLKQKGKTVIIATHNLRLARILADVCVVFSPDHRIAKVGRGEDVLSDTELLEQNNLLHKNGVL